MSAVPARDFVKALLLKAVLDKMARDEPRAVRAAPERTRRGRATPARPPDRETPASPRRAVPALALLAVGALLMLLFESPVTRVIGVLALFGFVVAGAFAIADPRWLASAPDLESSEGDRG
jgi:hypothetical protein